MECVNKSAKFEVVEIWPNSVAFSHSASQSTHHNYKKNFETFCEYIGKTPEQILAEYEEAELQRVPERTLRRKYAQYLQGWMGALNSQGYASGTIFIMVAAVQSFFKYNDLGLGHVPTGKLKVTFHNRDITKQDILNILDVSDVREKAYFLFMAQSGLRPHTICALRYKHIQPDFEKGLVPCVVQVPEDLTKGKYQSYFSFIGEESASALHAYFNLKEGKMGTESLIFSQKGHDEEPLDRRVISAYFHNAIIALKKRGNIDYTQRQSSKPGTVRLYNLRKWFRKQAAQAGQDYTNFWMGHVPKNPSDSRYFTPDEGNEKQFSEETIEHHRAIYAEKAMPYLRLESATPTETEKIIKVQKQEIEGLKEQIGVLTERLEISEFKQALEDLVLDLEIDVANADKEALQRDLDQTQNMMATLNQNRNKNNVWLDLWVRYEPRLSFMKKKIGQELKT